MGCEYRIDVINTFESMLSELTRLTSLIRKDADLPGMLEPLPYPALSSDNSREAACNLYQRCHYLDDQEGREILIGVGLLGVREETFKQAQQTNQAKRAFKSAVQQLKAQKLKLTDDWLVEAFAGLFTKHRDGFTQVALTGAGLSRLHLKQCYRQIPVLERRPEKVSWSWANTRAIKKITKQDAIQLLNKKGEDSGIVSQIAKVNSLSAHEQIAIVQELAPHLRTNIVFKTAGDEIERVMMKGSLPLLYPAQCGEDLPIMKLPKAQKTSERQSRNDVKIDPEPFLPAIRGHRYRVL